MTGGAAGSVRAICAIGRRGQLGLAGSMPWNGASGPEYAADIARFWAITRGHVLLCGPATFRSIPQRAFHGRTIEEVRSAMPPEEVLARFAARTVYIGGGPAVWSAYAPFIQHWDITRLPYDGEADRWFDPAWLCAG